VILLVHSSYHLLSGQKAVGQELAGSDSSSGISLINRNRETEQSAGKGQLAGFSFQFFELGMDAVKDGLSRCCSCPDVSDVAMMDDSSPMYECVFLQLCSSNAASPSFHMFRCASSFWSQAHGHAMPYAHGAC